MDRAARVLLLGESKEPAESTSAAGLRPCFRLALYRDQNGPLPAGKLWKYVMKAAHKSSSLMGVRNTNRIKASF